MKVKLNSVTPVEKEIKRSLFLLGFVMCTLRVRLSTVFSPKLVTPTYGFLMYYDKDSRIYVVVQLFLGFYLFVFIIFSKVEKVKFH